MKVSVAILGLVLGSLFLAAPAMAINLTWTGSGLSGSDPIGNDWQILDNGPGGNAVWGIPGNGLGNAIFQGPPGEWVTDFHITFVDASIVQTISDPAASNLTSMTDDTVNFVGWDVMFMNNDTVWFVAPAGERLDVGEAFFVNVVLDQPAGATGFAFTAEWTMVPEPSTLTLAALALVGLLAHRRRRT
jgi:MYXO-CTERM domain-containing protein